MLKRLFQKFSHLQLQIPSSRTETLFKWSRHRDATVDHPAYILNFKELSLDRRLQLSAIVVLRTLMATGADLSNLFG